MTVLYRLDAHAAAIATAFSAAAGADPWAGGTLAPGRFAPVITTGREFVAGPRAERQPRRLIPRLWGVPPPPGAADPARAVLTVRNAESPFWIGNLRNSEFRCLVPATAIMVWGKEQDREGRRISHWLAPSDQPLFAMAGVWKDSEVASFALLTCTANAAWRALGQDRMPVILPRDGAAQDLWLRGDWKRAGALLAPYPSSLIAEVSGSASRLPR